MKESDIDTVFDKLNSFHPILKVDSFDYGFIPYLGIKIVDNQITVYYEEDTHTDQNMHLSNFALCVIKKLELKLFFLDQ